MIFKFTSKYKDFDCNFQLGLILYYKELFKHFEIVCCLHMFKP